MSYYHQSQAVASLDLEDAPFQCFRTMVSNTPDQVLRYCRSGRPLWISAEERVAREEVCRLRKQEMLQMLTKLGRDANVDWSILAIYTCENSCSRGGGAERHINISTSICTASC